MRQVERALKDGRREKVRDLIVTPAHVASTERLGPLEGRGRRSRETVASVGGHNEYT